MTQQDLINLVNSLIIDNTSNQVTPAKVRQVLIAMIESQPASGGGTSFTAEYPLNINSFTNVLSYEVNPSGKIRLFQKGWDGTSENTAPYIQKNDICIAHSGLTKWGFFKYLGAGDTQVLSNYKQLFITNL